MNWPAVWKLFRGEREELPDRPENTQFYNELREFKQHLSDQHERIEAKIDRISQVIGDIRDSND